MQNEKDKIWHKEDIAKLEEIIQKAKELKADYPNDTAIDFTISQCEFLIMQHNKKILELENTAISEPEICPICGKPEIFQEDCDCNADFELNKDDQYYNKHIKEVGDFNTPIVPSDFEDEDLPF